MQAQLSTGSGAPGAAGDGRLDQSKDLAAICGRGHASSPSLRPQIASAFFRKIMRAAASASAFSLRASSRSRSLIRFLSSRVSRAIR